MISRSFIGHSFRGHRGFIYLFSMRSGPLSLRRLNTSFHKPLRMIWKAPVTRNWNLTFLPTPLNVRFQGNPALWCREAKTSAGMAH